MNEANRKRLHETIIRLVNGEEVTLRDYEIYFDVNRLKSSLYPFMMRRRLTKDMSPESPVGIAIEARVPSLIEATGPIPWYKQALFPVLCYVSNVMEKPAEPCQIRLVCGYQDSDSLDLNKLETVEEKMFMDDCGKMWKYSTPVPSETMDKWKLFS